MEHEAVDGIRMNQPQNTVRKVKRDRGILMQESEICGGKTYEAHSKIFPKLLKFLHLSPKVLIKATDILYK